MLISTTNTDIQTDKETTTKKWQNKRSQILVLSIAHFKLKSGLMIFVHVGKNRKNKNTIKFNLYMTDYYCLEKKFWCSKTAMKNKLTHTPFSFAHPFTSKARISLWKTQLTYCQSLWVHNLVTCYRHGSKENNNNFKKLELVKYTLSYS